MLTIIEHKQHRPVSHDISQSIHRRSLWRVRRSQGGADVISDGVWLRKRRKISPPDVVLVPRCGSARELLRQARLPNTSRSSQRQQSCLTKRSPQLDQFAVAPKEWS
jgi:hypothetical protein